MNQNQTRRCFNNHRIFLQIVGAPLYRRLIMPVALCLFLLAQADAITDWAEARQQLAALPHWQLACLIAGLVSLWCLLVGAALRPVWSQPVFRFLVRQPIDHKAWAGLLTPSLLPALIPLAAVGWLMPSQAAVPIQYWLLSITAIPTILGASYRGANAARWFIVGTLATAILALIYLTAHLLLAFFLSLITGLLLLPSFSGIRHEIDQQVSQAGGTLSSRSPVACIIKRDLICLWRLERKPILNLLLLAVPAVLFMLALRLNEELVGREAFAYASGLLAITALPLYDLLTRLKANLGRNLMHRYWPVDPNQRTGALIGLMTCLFGPSLLGLSIVGSVMGPALMILFVIHGATTIVLLSVLFTWTSTSAAEYVGWSLWILFAQTLLVLTLPALAYCLLAALIMVVGFRWIANGWNNFTEQMPVSMNP